MKTVALLALIAGSVSAFTGMNVASSLPRTAVTQSAAMEDMVGSVDLRGKEFKFDPVCLYLQFVLFCFVLCSISVCVCVFV